MILLIDARNLGCKPSGVGMYAYNWIKALDEIDDLEIHIIVDVVESDQIKELETEGKVQIHKYGKHIYKTVSVYKYFRFVQNVINEVRPDVFWETNNMSPIKIKNPYGKYVVTIHDMFPLTMPDCFGKVYPYYFKFGVTKTVKNVDGIIYISNCTKKETEKYFYSARNKKSIVASIIIPQVPQMVVEEEEYFLYMGNLEKRKGTDILLDAYERYVKEGGKKELKIAGKVRETDIEERIKELQQIIPTLHYLGYVDDDTRTRLYRECGCFVFPSRAEGFGMPLIEAMQCGKPVIASNLEIFEELVGDVITTFELDETGNATEKLAILLRDEVHPDWSEREKISKQAEKYSAGNLVSGMMKFLRNL